MQKLNDLNEPATKIIADHNNGDAEKSDSSEANGFMDKFYFAVEDEMMLASNLRVGIGLNNGAKRKFVDFVYTPAE